MSLRIFLIIALACFTQRAHALKAWIKVNGQSGTVTLKVGETANYTWGSEGAVNGSSSFAAENPFCGSDRGPHDFLAHTISGSDSAPVEECQADNTFQIFYAVDDGTEKFDLAQVNVIVPAIVKEVEPPPPPDVDTPKLESLQNQTDKKVSEVTQKKADDSKGEQTKSIEDVKKAHEDAASAAGTLGTHYCATAANRVAENVPGAEADLANCLKLLQAADALNLTAGSPGIKSDITMMDSEDSIGIFDRLGKNYTISKDDFVKKVLYGRRSEITLAMLSGGKLYGAEKNMKKSEGSAKAYVAKPAWSKNPSNANKNSVAAKKAFAALMPQTKTSPEPSRTPSASGNPSTESMSGSTPSPIAFPFGKSNKKEPDHLEPVQNDVLFGTTAKITDSSISSADELTNEPSIFRLVSMKIREVSKRQKLNSK